MDNKSIFVVTYRDSNYDEPVVTLFDNEDAANECYKHFKTIHAAAWLDTCQLYSKFTINKQEKGK